MKVLQVFLMVMGVLAILAIIALIIGYILAFLTPDIRSSMRPVVLSSEAVDSLNEKIVDLKKSVATAESTKTQKDIEFVMTEEEINSALVMMLAEGTLPAKEILVNFNDGYLLTYTAWNVPGLPLKTGIFGQIEVEDGKPKMFVRDFFLGKLAVPDEIDRGVENLANIIIKLNIPLEELRLTIKDVTIGEGQMRISAVTKAAK
ncbi:MAG: hypothetical protein PHO26_09260 [Dehalococcoidia bacterium]|nr:hypothetical protein [Dehalococcoidia bacterium]